MKIGMEVSGEAGRNGKLTFTKRARHGEQARQQNEGVDMEKNWTEQAARQSKVIRHLASYFQFRLSNLFIPKLSCPPRIGSKYR
jgi:hypothetical protein